jgi:AraC-like DNA-binding protein
MAEFHPSSSELTSLFASGALPAELEGSRLGLIQQFNKHLYGAGDRTLAAEQPFCVRLQTAYFGAVLVDDVSATRAIASDGGEAVFIGFAHHTTHNRSVRGSARVASTFIMLFHADPGGAQRDSSNRWFLVYVPQAQLCKRVANADHLVARRIEGDHPALRFLQRYVKFVLERGSTNDDSALNEHIGDTLIDLVVLCLDDPGRHIAERALMGGLRAARLQAIKAEIRGGFSQPEFSVRQVAMSLGFSPRYVQELLREAGPTFTDRVKELRLQKAHAMLTSRNYDHLKVIDIAYACGFNGISYFNRCFRQRFGDVPKSCRESTRSTATPKQTCRSRRALAWGWTLCQLLGTFASAIATDAAGLCEDIEVCALGAW